MVSFLDSVVVSERADGSHAWLVDSDKEEAQEFMSLNRDGVWGTGGIFCRAAKGSLSDIVSEDWNS